MAARSLNSLLAGSAVDTLLNDTNASITIQDATVKDVSKEFAASRDVLDKAERARIVWVGVYSMVLIMLFIFVNIVVVTLLIGSARGWLTIDSGIMKTLVAATIVEVIGVLYIAARYVFSNFFTHEPGVGKTP